MMNELRVFRDLPLYAIALVGLCVAMSLFIDRSLEVYIMAYIGGMAVYTIMVMIENNKVEL